MEQNPYPKLEASAMLVRDDLPEETRLERLSFHLKTGDYFPMLATILGFVQETVQECSCGITKGIAPIETDVIKGARKDLLYLHENYRIVKHKGGEAAHN